MTALPTFQTGYMQPTWPDLSHGVWMMHWVLYINLHAVIVERYLYKAHCTPIHSCSALEGRKTALCLCPFNIDGIGPHDLFVCLHQCKTIPALAAQHDFWSAL